MPRVSIADSSCRAFTGDETSFEVEGDTVRRVIAALDRRFPGLGAHIEARMAIAIDGVIHQDALFEPVAATAELYLIPKIGGG